MWFGSTSNPLIDSLRRTREPTPRGDTVVLTKALGLPLAISPLLFRSKLKTLLFNKSYLDSSSSPYLSRRLNSKHYPQPSECRPTTACLSGSLDLWVSWFPLRHWLRVCGSCRNFKFMITVYDYDKESYRYLIFHHCSDWKVWMNQLFQALFHNHCVSPFLLHWSLSPSVVYRTRAKNHRTFFAHRKVAWRWEFVSCRQKDPPMQIASIPNFCCRRCFEVSCTGWTFICVSQIIKIIISYFQGSLNLKQALNNMTFVNETLIVQCIPTKG